MVLSYRFRYFCTPPLFDAPISRGARRNIATKFRAEKIEWCGYQTVKKFTNMFTHCDTIHERDGRTNGHTEGHI